MKIYNYEATELISVTEDEYENFIEELHQKDLLRRYLGRVYTKAVEIHKQSLPEWKYGNPAFVRMNSNGIISIFFDTFDEFFYMVKPDGVVGWCRKEECESTFPEHFANIKRMGLQLPICEQVDRPFSYFK